MPVFSTFFITTGNNSIHVHTDFYRITACFVKIGAVTAIVKEKLYFG